MGLFAMPVVYSEREWSQMVGESYYIQLGPGDKFGWTEPEGKVYQIAADNLTQVAGRDLPGLLSGAGGRVAGCGRVGNRASASSWIFRSRRRCCGPMGTR